MARRYKIKDGKDEGVGAYHVYVDGDWLETTRTMEAAEAVVTERQKYDIIHGASHRVAAQNKDDDD